MGWISMVLWVLVRIMTEHTDQFRKRIKELSDSGKTDKEILDLLLAEGFSRDRIVNNLTRVKRTRHGES